MTIVVISLINFLHYIILSHLNAYIYPYLIYYSAISSKIKHLLLNTITGLFTILNFR